MNVLRLGLLVSLILISAGQLRAQTNVALDQPVDLVGAEFFFPLGGGLSVDPQTVVDGVFLPASSDWNQGPVWWLDWECASHDGACAIEIDLGGAYLIDAFIFQGDSDTYRLQFRNIGRDRWELAWEVPSTWGYVQTRPNLADNSERFMLPAAILTDRLRLEVALDGPGSDGYLAVSEVQAFGDPAEYPDPIFADGFEQQPG